MKTNHITLLYRSAAAAVGLILVSGVVRYVTEFEEVPEWFRHILGISVVVTTLTGSICIALLLVMAKKVRDSKSYYDCRRISFWMLWLIPFGLPLGLLSYGLLGRYMNQNGAE